MSIFVSKIGEPGGSGPALATFLGGVNILASVAVWTESVKGWAALITVILGVPTSICILLYWVLKLKHEWKDKKNRSDL